MLCHPFRAVFALIISYGNFDLPQNLFVDLADRRAECRQRLRRVPFKDGREIFRLEPMFFRQSAAAEEHILNARRRRISESQFEVEFIISHQK